MGELHEQNSNNSNSKKIIPEQNNWIFGISQQTCVVEGALSTSDIQV
jgi:hypothetical protein